MPKEVIMLPWNSINNDECAEETEKKSQKYNRKLNIRRMWVKLYKALTSYDMLVVVGFRFLHEFHAIQ